MQLNEKVRLGKSTIAITLVMSLLELIRRYYKDLFPHNEFIMKNLCRDDQEKTFYTYQMFTPKELNKLIKNYK